MNKNLTEVAATESARWVFKKYRPVDKVPLSSITVQDAIAEGRNIAREMYQKMDPQVKPRKAAEYFIPTRIMELVSSDGKLSYEVWTYPYVRG